MTVDAHQHFWRYEPRDYAWIDERMNVLKRNFLPGDLGALLREHAVDRTIAVQACQTDAETEWLLQLAAANPFIAGVVGWVDLQADDIDDKLKLLAADAKLVGIRHVLQSEPDDAFMLRPEFRRGVAALAPHGLVYDILIYPRHLPIAWDFVGHFASQPFVLDHLAKPEIRSRSIDEWARDLRRLAQHPNVWCKVSGLVTEADWQRWTAKDLEPYLDVAFDCFGAGRLIAGSDWPVCTLAGDYSRTMTVLRDYLERRTPEERDAVLGGNAQRLYKRGCF